MAGHRAAAVPVGAHAARPADNSRSQACLLVSPRRRNAFEKGIENIKPEAGIKLIEYWEEALSSVDIPGTKGIARDLEALKKALGNETPDEERIKNLLGKLSEEVTKIAGRTEGAVQPKLNDLGEALKAA